MLRISITLKNKIDDFYKGLLKERKENLDIFAYQCILHINVGKNLGPLKNILFHLKTGYCTIFVILKHDPSKNLSLHRNKLFTKNIHTQKNLHK